MKLQQTEERVKLVKICQGTYCQNFNWWNYKKDNVDFYYEILVADQMNITRRQAFHSQITLKLKYKGNEVTECSYDIYKRWHKTDVNVKFTTVCIECRLWVHPYVVLKFVQYKQLSFEIWTVIVHHPHRLLLQQKIPLATSTLNLSVGMASA